MVKNSYIYHDLFLCRKLYSAPPGHVVVWYLGGEILLASDYSDLQHHFIWAFLPTPFPLSLSLLSPLPLPTSSPFLPPLSPATSLFSRTTHNLLDKKQVGVVYTSLQITSSECNYLIMYCSSRHAQLRDCLEVPRQHVPLPDKLTTLALFQSAKKCI